MTPTMCSRCGKNVAVVYITKLEQGTSKNEGLCLLDVDSFRFRDAPLFQAIFQCPGPEGGGHFTKFFHFRRHGYPGKIHEAFLILPQPQGHGRDIFRKAGVFILQKGYHMMPQTVPEKGIAGIGTVIPEVHSVLLQKFHHILPGD